MDQNWPGSSDAFDFGVNGYRVTIVPGVVRVPWRAALHDLSVRPRIASANGREFHGTMAFGSVLVRCGELGFVELDHFRRILVEVDVANPRRPDADVRDPRPSLALAAVGKHVEVDLFEAAQLIPG